MFCTEKAERTSVSRTEWELWEGWGVNDTPKGEKTWYLTQSQMTQSLSHLLCGNLISHAHTQASTCILGSATILDTPKHLCTHSPRWCRQCKRVCVCVCRSHQIFHNAKLLDTLYLFTHSLKTIKTKSPISVFLSHPACTFSETSYKYEIMCMKVLQTHARPPTKLVGGVANHRDRKVFICAVWVLHMQNVPQTSEN